MNNNYEESLSQFLYDKMNAWQTDLTVRKMKPMTWPAGLYFSVKELEKWIKEHDNSTK